MNTSTHLPVDNRASLIIEALTRINPKSGVEISALLRHDKAATVDINVSIMNALNDINEGLVKDTNSDNLIGRYDVSVIIHPGNEVASVSLVDVVTGTEMLEPLCQGAIQGIVDWYVRRVPLN